MKAKVISLCISTWSHAFTPAWRAHLLSIVITSAHIGRQQHTSDNDDKNYCHALLIIEVKKGPLGGSPLRHVLCVESDAKRDSWVDILVRYVSCASNEDVPAMQPSCPSPISISDRKGKVPRRHTRAAQVRMP